MLSGLFAILFFGLALLHILEPAALASDPPYPTFGDVAARVAFWLFLSTLFIASTLATRPQQRRLILAGFAFCPIIATLLVAGVSGIAGTVIFAVVYAAMTVPGVFLAMRAV